MLVEMLSEFSFTLVITTEIMAEFVLKSSFILESKEEILAIAISSEVMSLMF